MTNPESGDASFGTARCSGARPAASSSNSPSPGATTNLVKLVVIIIQENRSFEVFHGFSEPSAPMTARDGLGPFHLRD